MEDSHEHNNNIKTVQLYKYINRIYSELKELNILEDDPLDAEIVSKFDSLHYLGNEAIESAIEKGKIKKGDKIFDVGSGLGGPARVMAARTGCFVDAIELQHDFHEIATNLTKRCALDNQVNHILGDIFEFNAAENYYDGIVSWQVFLHIPERQKIFEKCYKFLKPNGFFYIEDLYMRKNFSEVEKIMLKKDIFIQSLPKIDEYQEQIKNAGFSNILIEDMTEKYTAFAVKRISDFQQEFERHKKVHGQEAAECQRSFLISMDKLFQGGNLGGVRILSKKTQFL